MARSLKLFARKLACLVILGATSPARATVETEDGEFRSLDKAAAETVRRVIGRKRQGLLSPLDGEEAQAILSAVEAKGYVGDIFEVTLRGITVLFVVEGDGLAFLAW